MNSVCKIQNTWQSYTDPDIDKLNVVASEDGKTLTVTLAYPCSYFDKIVAFGTMSPVQQATVEANGILPAL